MSRGPFTSGERLMWSRKLLFGTREMRLPIRAWKVSAALLDTDVDPSGGEEGVAYSKLVT